MGSSRCIASGGHFIAGGGWTIAQLVTPSDKVIFPFGGPTRTLSRYRKVAIEFDHYNTTTTSCRGGNNIFAVTTTTIIIVRLYDHDD